LTGFGVGADGRDKRGGSGSANEVATALHWRTLDASSDDASFSERLELRQTIALEGDLGRWPCFRKSLHDRVLTESARAIFRVDRNMLVFP
jgi:hypothetical protein